jgi:hypothetical protein
VLKDAWNPCHQTPEGDFYDKLTDLDGIAKCYLWVQVDINGVLDNTDKLICHSIVDLDSLGCAIDLGSEKLEDSIELGDLAHDSQGQTSSAARALVLQQWPRPRNHYRLLLTTSGWPLRQFFNLKELLEVLHDAVGGESYCLS